MVTWMKEDGHAECRFSTMFALYALPHDFPGYSDAAREIDPYRRIDVVEDALRSDVDDIGLSTMRSKCSHFRAWIESLERLGQAS